MVQVLVSVTGMTLGATVTTGTVGATTEGVTTVTVMTTAAVTTGECQAAPCWSPDVSGLGLMHVCASAGWVCRCVRFLLLFQLQSSIKDPNSSLRWP